MVNVIEPDVAVITNIGLDHTDWLGDTIEKIAFERQALSVQIFLWCLAAYNKSLEAIIDKSAACSCCKTLCSES